MARNNRKLVTPTNQPERTVAEASDLRAAALETSADLGGVSPVSELQRRVQSAYSQPETRWSARKTLAFIVAVCGSFWIAVAMVVLALR